MSSHRVRHTASTPPAICVEALRRPACVILLAALVAISLSACADEPQPRTSVVRTPTPAVATPGPAEAATSLPTSTPAATRTPAATATSRPTVTPRPTTTPTVVASPIPTATSPPTPVPTATRVASSPLFRFDNGRWLEAEDPHLASAIKVLNWVSDGISGSESPIVQDLLYIAVSSRTAASAIVALGWVEDEVDRIEADTIRNLAYLADDDARIAEEVISLVWMQDGIEDVEGRAMRDLAHVSNVSTEVASAVTALPWFRDGIGETEADAIDWISNFADQRVALSLLSLDWMLEEVDRAEVSAIEGLSYISNDGADLGASVIGLEWVADGIDAAESETIELLAYISGDSTEVGLAVARLAWMKDDISRAEFEALDWINNFESSDVALELTGAAWMQDVIGEVEVRAIENLSYIANDNSDTASQVVAVTWLQDGVEVIEANMVEELAYVSERSAELAAVVSNLPWFLDDTGEPEVGMVDWINNFEEPETALSLLELKWMLDSVEEHEVTAVEHLSYIANDNTDTASQVVAVAWLQDGVEVMEANAVEELAYVSGRSPELAAVVSNLPWFLDDIGEPEVGMVDWINNFEEPETALSLFELEWMLDSVEEHEVTAVEQLSYISNDGVAVATSIIQLSWLRDDIVELETKTVEDLAFIAGYDAATALGILSLEWVMDGIGESEAAVIEDISYISNDDPRIVGSLLSMDWMRDGVDGIEAGALEELSYMSESNSAQVLRIVDMPFLLTVEPPDVAALESLSQLSGETGQWFSTVMSHPTLRGGITDDLTPIVSTLNGVADESPDLVNVLLDPSRVSVEWRTVSLPLSGEMVLCIIRTAPGHAESMDLLEDAVRGVEEYMGLPLPTNYVGLLYEHAMTGGFAGTNFGTHIAILPGYDVGYGGDDVDSPGLIVAHEVAHYYWSGNADWIDEGAANLLATLVGSGRIGRPLVTNNRPCAYARSIEEVERMNATRSDVEFECNYSLGERLFLDLSRTLGGDRFREGFRNLYLATEDQELEEGAHITHVAEAFGSEDGATSMVIGRWYDGSEPYEFSTPDPSPVDPMLSSINGRLNGAFVSLGQNGPAVYSFSPRDVHDWVYLTIEASYEVSGPPRTVPLTVVEYYEDGFAFSYGEIELVAEKDYAGNTMWFPVGAPEGAKWAPGQYVVYLYADGVKAAEVEYRVTQ